MAANEIRGRSTRRILLLAFSVYLLDQVTKLVVLRFLGLEQEHDVVPGFFKFVHWGNTGAAWSLFRHNNHILAGISAVAMIALWIFRRHFEADRPAGQAALGLLFGGIAGNLTDRVLPTRQHVIDFLRFYLVPREGGEMGFPAFNVADTAICIGVGLLLLLSWQSDVPRTSRGVAERPATPE
ncbi:MAG: Lipoprotein signal peptidase [Verrucomicrobiota bacterium]|jgi:signal peptidase II